MLFGRGRVSAADASASFTLAGRMLPRVITYKYLGVMLAARSGGQNHVALVREKAVKKTGEIVGWCRQHEAPLEIAVKLWDLYVLRSLLYGAAVLTPSTDPFTQMLLAIPLMSLYFGGASLVGVVEREREIESSS